MTVMPLIAGRQTSSLAEYLQMQNSKDEYGENFDNN